MSNNWFQYARKVCNDCLQPLTFQRQLGITVTLGIIFLALSSSLVGSWQSKERIRVNLLEQGQRITESLGRQSALALIYSSPENVEDAVNATLAFPGVIGLEIRDANQRILLKRGELDETAFSVGTQSKQTDSGAALDSESPNAWRFAAPVYSQPADTDSPFDVMPVVPELLGQVFVVISKAALRQTTTDIFVTNIITSISFALVFLLLIRFLTHRMTEPLNQLSLIMGRAKAGEPDVRATLVGSKDIADMAHAFNSMMEVMEEREAALRIAAIAFEIEEGMIVTDQEGIVIRVNRVFTELTGYSADEAIGKNLSMVQSDREDDNFFSRMLDVLYQQNYWQGEIWNQRKNGEVYPEWLTITAVVGKDGDITNYICAFFDITERKQAEEKIHKLAFYDHLCKLPNRRLLFERLQQAVTVSVRKKTCGGVLFIDLDNFKILNDTRGHDFGDLLLIEVAQRLRTCIRQSDTLARLGGDEFVILLEDLSMETSLAALQAREVGEKVLKVLTKPYTLKNIECYSTASIGISLYSNYKDGIENMIRQADTAMYEAKRAGRNTLRFFDPAMQEELEMRSEIEAGIRKALLNNEFQLNYQVQVDGDQRYIGAEALIRWKSPELGMVSPAKFIPISEDTGLILPIGQWVLETACAQLKAWENNSLTHDLTLAVNVSAKQFRQPGFVAQVSEIILRSGIKPVRLKLELTESTVLDNVPDTIQKMQALKLMGIRFSMDDFGTGYSSLSYLTQLPLDQLKIDQSFVRNISKKSTDLVIIQTIIGMANNLGIEVIAEGVETIEQRDLLWDLGCRIYQGYLFGRPSPNEQFIAALG